MAARIVLQALARCQRIADRLRPDIYIGQGRREGSMSLFYFPIQGKRRFRLSDWNLFRNPSRTRTAEGCPMLLLDRGSLAAVGCVALKLGRVSGERKPTAGITT